jgi:hypothetical protein
MSLGINFKNMSTVRSVLLSAMTGIFLLSGLFHTYKDVSAFIRKRKIQPYAFMGDQFKELRHTIKNIPRIGYYTDRSFSNIYTEAQFTQAQFILAPVILDLHSLEHPFIIFDYENRTTALEKIKNAGMLPILVNRQGIILARNPKYQMP